MIDFNVPPYVGTEMEYVRQSAEDNHKICGDGPFTKRCQSWLEERFCADKVLLTTSGTTALEMAAMLCDLEPGDEVFYLFEYGDGFCSHGGETRVRRYPTRHEEYRSCCH